MYNRSDVLAAGLRCWRVRRSIRQGVCQPVFLTTSASGSAKAIASRFLVVTAPGSRHCFEYSTASIRQPPAGYAWTAAAKRRTERRRVGTECVRTCRSRGTRYHEKNKKRNNTTRSKEK